MDEEVEGKLMIMKEPEDESCSALFSIWVESDGSIGGKYPLCYHMPIDDAAESVKTYLEGL